MVSLEMDATPAAGAAAAATSATTSPRISFSGDFLNDCNFITIDPAESIRNPDHFEFLSGDVNSHPTTISTADELFFEGKLLPFWHNRKTEKQEKKIMGVEEKDANIVAVSKKENGEEELDIVEKKVDLESSRMNWFVDDDPSPRPPKCTVLWKELLRLKKQRPHPPYPSPSSSSGSFGEKEKKGLERSRSGTLRIRPMAMGKSNTLPPLFPEGGRRHN